MEQSESAHEPQGRNLDTAVAVLIAVTTLIGAFFAWRSSAAGDGAGDADYAGLRAVVNVEETRARSTVNAYESFRAYTSFARHEALARLMEEDRSGDAAELRVLAKASRGLFNPKFVKRDGTFAAERELGSAWADAAREMDLNPDPQFAEADRLRRKSLGLLAALTVASIALVFFTLVASVGQRLQLVSLVLGMLFLAAGTGLGAYYELLAR